MSGGVDSAAAALLLSRKGYEVTGVTLLLSGNEKDAADAAASCEILGIKHLTLDLRDEFVELVERPFCEAYLAGQTPNPCVICNKRIKLGKLLDYADQNGYDAIATGHYVRRETIDGHTVLRRAADEKKDQSYMLWQLSEEQLSRAVFPLAELTKDEIRDLTRAASLPVFDRHDSQDICFVPDGDYVSFIKKLTGYETSVGDFIDRNGKVIGKHQGNVRYTVGQRKGLGVGFGEPMYVLSRDPKANTVTLGRDSELYRQEIVIRDINVFSITKLPARCDVKIRYAHKPCPALVERIDETHLKITFDEPQRAPARGQSAVLYLGDLLAGGGFIE